MQCPIPTVDLNGLTIDVCYKHVPSISIPDAELSNLKKSVSVSNAGRWPAAPNLPEVIVRPGPGMKSPIAPEDLRDVAILVCNGEMLFIHHTQSEQANLDKAGSKSDAIGIADWPAPGIVVGPGSWVQGTIVPVNLSSLAIFVGNGEVIAIDGSQTPMAQLDEAITKGSKLGITRAMCHLLGCTHCGIGMQNNSQTDPNGLTPWYSTTPEVLYPWKRDEKGTTWYNDPFARV